MTRDEQVTEIVKAFLEGLVTSEEAMNQISLLFAEEVRGQI